MKDDRKTIDDLRQALAAGNIFGYWRHHILDVIAIAERAIAKPVESPDDWVTQDRVPARCVDEFHWSCWGTSDFRPVGMTNVGYGKLHGWIDPKDNAVLSVRCRRKDLPPMPEPPPQPRKQKVRLWGIRKYLDARGMVVMCCPAERAVPDADNEWIEIKTDADGSFYVEAPQ